MLAYAVSSHPLPGHLMQQTELIQFLSAVWDGDAQKCSRRLRDLG